MGRHGERAVRRAWIVAAILVTAACGSAGPSTGATPSQDPLFPSRDETDDDPMTHPTVDGLFSIGADGQLAMRCWGRGTPVIVLEAGTDSSGIEQFAPTIGGALAERTMTCTYDRLGAGLSDAAPHHRRTLDDLVLALHELLEAAAVPAPYVLVGSSGGGAIVIHYAGTYRDDVVGLVLLDVAAPEPEMAEEFPEEAGWDNAESVDWFGMGPQLAYHREPIAVIPVRIVTAGSGQSDTKGQAYWLRLSPLATQRTIDGGHVLYRDNPEGVVAQIGSVLRSIESDG